MSEWAKELLADVARETIVHVSFESDEHQDVATRTVVAVLERRLLGLLEVGEAMRQGIGAYAVALNASPFVQAGTMTAIRQCVDGLQAWDAAKSTAMKEPT